MKRRITKVKPDGSREVYEIDDEAPALRKAQQPSGQLASQGQRGDTELAHVNPWEQALLKRLGGAGTQNPQTGMRQFYTNTPTDWYGAPSPMTPYVPTGTYQGATAPYQPPSGPPQPTSTGGADMFDPYVFLNTISKIPGYTNPNAQTISPEEMAEFQRALTQPMTASAVQTGQVAGPGQHYDMNGNVVNDTSATYYTPTGTAPTGADVNSWYRAYLGREPDPAGREYWLNYGDTPDETADPFSAWRAAATPEMAARNTAGGGTVTPTTPVPIETIQPITQTPGPTIPVTPTTWGGNTWYGMGGLGETGTSIPVTPSTPVTPGGGMGGTGINIPLDIFPSSTSLGTSSSEQSASNLGVGGSENVSMNQSRNYAGLPASYQEALLAAIMPTLQNAITNMPGNIDQYTNQALGSYQQMMQNALRTALPRAMAGLANRGIINSTEGQNVLGQVGSAAAIDAANKGYTTAMQAALLKANMPQMLSQIMDLGRTSYGTSTGAAAGSSANINMGQSAGTSSSQQGSYWEDPTVMYRTLADVIRSMMPSNY